MFCIKCGNQMSDGEAFCTKCGVPVTFIYPQNTVEQKLGINTDKVVFDLVTTAGASFLVYAVVAFIGGWLLDKSLVSMGEAIRVGFLGAFLETIQEALVVRWRIKDPDDTAYDIGSTQDEETNKKFLKKYHKFQTVTEWIIIIAAIIFVGCPMLVEFNEQYGEEISDIFNSLSETSAIIRTQDVAPSRPSSICRQLSATPTASFSNDSREDEGIVSIITIIPYGELFEIVNI